MQLSKDEAAILSVALEEFKYECVNRANSKTEALDIIDAMTSLQKRLEDFGTDKRRTGRKSQDHFSDKIKRLVKRHKHSLDD